MKIRSPITLLVILTALFQGQVLAKETAYSSESVQPGDTFARQGDVVLTHGELDAAFSRIPPDIRLVFIRDGARVDSLVKSLLRIKLIAADAVRSEFDKDPIIAERIQLAAEKELAEAWVAHVIENAPEADYEALAHEYYLAHPEEFMAPEMVDVSHILISSETRSEEEALEMAEQLSEDLSRDKSLFDGYIAEYSEDPAKSTNGGRYPDMQRGQMVKRFEEAAFSLQQAGELTGPVKTSYGYHIIRLNQAKPSEVVPFEQIREQAREMAKEQYLSEYRSRYVKQRVEGMVTLEDGAAEAMVRRYYGDDAELLTDTPE
jgi:hypothetical protein